MTAFSVTSCDSQVSIFAVADVMEKNGWTMERQMDSLHFSILPSHTPERAQQLLSALREAVTTVKANPALSRTGSAGLYGMVAKIPDKAVVNDFILEFFNELYTL
ncbi:Sphingosine-1-phosphate lyase [Geodia barretti]|uniref:Sphingosine-1-phosphate lyase n=1 Tax=Geodia barretti TaxID=519541 RepID=A0AA35SMQ5_GEOBA|nr:Sphingosine-1-phosphate lyase [Geodia barretti]